MGVDYSSVGGIGIEIDDEIKNMITDRYCTENGIEEDSDEYDELYFSEILDELEIDYSEGGSGCYGGDSSYYLLVDGNTLLEVQNNTDEFIKNLKNIGIEITVEDLQVISDLHIY